MDGKSQIQLLKLPVMQLRQLPDNQSMAREEKEEEGDEEEDGDEMAGSCPGSVRHI